MTSLDGKRAVVTGASSGIGQATAIALAAAGAHVGSIYLTDPEGAALTEQSIRDAGRQAVFIEGDVSDAAQVEGLARRLDEAWGGIDIWVNNAAQLLVRSFLEMTEGEWRSVMATNLDGYYHGCKVAASRMVRQRSGRIINVSSLTDIQPIEGLTAYITAKGGVVGLTRALALELAPFGVTVNAIAPGAIMTSLTQTTYTPEVIHTYEERIPLGRIGRPEEIADAIVFLASDASRYITGHELVADGGLVLNGNVGFSESERSDS